MLLCCGLFLSTGVAVGELLHLSLPKWKDMKGMSLSVCLNQDPHDICQIGLTDRSCLFQLDFPFISFFLLHCICWGFPGGGMVSTSCLSIHLLMDIQVFCVLAIVNSTAVNVGVHVSFQTIFFSRYMSGVGLQDHMVALVLLKESPYCSS